MNVQLPIPREDDLSELYEAWLAETRTPGALTRKPNMVDVEIAFRDGVRAGMAWVVRQELELEVGV